MWCIVSSSTCRSRPLRSSTVLSRSPSSSTNPYDASDCARRASSRPRTSSASPDRSTTGSAWRRDADTTWRASPSTSFNRVRNTAWRDTSDCRLRHSTGTSSSPSSTVADGMLYALPGPSSRYRNHSRCCAYDSGHGPAPDRASSAGPLEEPAPARRRARPDSVGDSNTLRIGSSTPDIDRTRATRRVASSECPPSAKKSSSRPTRSTPSRPCHSSASARSSAVSGAAYAAPLPAPYSGAGSALRSTLPFAFSGRRSRRTSADGTM